MASAIDLPLPRQPRPLPPSRNESLPLPADIWAIAGLALVLRVSIALATHFTSEDYLITLRYAENLAHGHGFVYNLGEHTLGTTTPLYTLFLALIARLGLPATLLGKSLNILADSALCLLVYRWLRYYGDGTGGRIAAFLIAVLPLHIQWAVSGMETSLVTLCGVWVWTLYAERQTTKAYGVAAVLFLLRWDSILLIAVLTLAVCRRDRRLPRRGLGLFLLLVAPWPAIMTWYFGTPIPVTAAAKSTVYGWRAAHNATWLLRTLPRLPNLYDRFFGTPGYALLTLSALWGVLRIRKERLRSLYAPVAWFLLYWLSFLLSRVLLFPWYLVPPLPVYEILAALGAAGVFRRLIRRMPCLRSRAVLLPALTILVVACGGVAYTTARGEQVIEDTVRIPIALWLKAHSRPTDRIMLEPIGYIGYYSERPILDVVGLVTPAVLSDYKLSNEAPMLAIAERFQPEWCVLRPGEIARIQRAARSLGISWEARYTLVRTFSYTPTSYIYSIYRRK